MKKMLFGSWVVLSLFSCKTTRQLSHYEYKKNFNITDSIHSDEKIDAFISPFKMNLEKQMNVKISYTPIELSKTGNNHHLGNLLADFTFEAGNEWLMKNNFPNADAALLNTGGIRATIDQGDILMKNIFEVMPFENELVIVQFKGKDLDGLFQYYEKTQKNNPVSRMTIEVTNGVLTKALINGKNIQPERDYFIVTSNYLALGGDDMAFFSKGQIFSTGIKLRDVFIEKFRKNNPLKIGELEQRLHFHQTTK